MKKNLLYTLICLILYLAFAGIDILIKPLVDYIDTSFKTYFIVYNILFFINLILTKTIADKIYSTKINKKPKDTLQQINES